MHITSAMRQAGNPSSVDKLRMRERFRFQKNDTSKNSARRIAAKRWQQAKMNDE